MIRDMLDKNLSQMNYKIIQLVIIIGFLQSIEKKSAFDFIEINKIAKIEKNFKGEFQDLRRQRKMEDNNFLLEESHNDGSYQLRLKVKYLQQDKQKLEVANNEMKENIKLLREINKELAKSTPQTQQSELIRKLQQQTKHLQTSYLRIMDQNNTLTCRNLMLQQIIQQQQTEHIQILKGYQSKIVQLRRSIQFKESCIQSFQQNPNYNGNGYEVGNIPPSNISMVFFGQIDQYKNTIRELENKVTELEEELDKVKEKNDKLEQDRILIDSMIKSRSRFYMFRQRFNANLKGKTIVLSQEKIQNPRSFKSLAKKQPPTQSKNNKPQKSKQTLHSSQPQQTREISYQCTSGNFKLNQLKDQLKKVNTEFAKLAIKYKKQQTKRKQNDQKIKILLNSNKFYKQKRQTNIDELNYFKRTTSDLLRLIEKRKVKRTYSVDKTEIEQLISSIKKPQEIQLVQNNKKYWQKVQEQLKNKMQSKTKTDLETINRFRLKKSFSDILDFSPMCHDDDKIDKYYHKKNTNSNKDIFNSVKEFQFERNKNNLDDFSKILELGANGQIFDDQTLIIKAKPISYAERKKTKTRSKASDVHNLTIIRENVL